MAKGVIFSGWQAVYEGVIEALKGLEPEAGHEFLHSAMDILGTSDRGGASLKLTRSIEFLPLLSSILERNIENYKKFTNCK